MSWNKREVETEMITVRTSDVRLIIHDQLNLVKA